MHLKSNKGDINLSLLITTFIVCIVIAVGVAFFHSQYYPGKFLEYKSSEISDKFFGSDNFAVTAKKLLNSRTDISYLKQLDQNGVLEESFGNDKAPGTKKFVVNGPNNKSIIMGLKTVDAPLFDTYALIWSLLIGSGMALILISIISMKGSKPAKSMKKLEGAMERISQGDYTARLDVDSPSDEEIHIINTYQGFNRMADSLNKKYKTEEISSEQLDEIKPEVKEFVAQNEDEISEEILEEHKEIEPTDEIADELTEDQSSEVFADSEGEDEEFDLKSSEEDIALDTDEEEERDIYEEEGYSQEDLEESVVEPESLYDEDTTEPESLEAEENEEIPNSNIQDNGSEDIEKQSSFRPKIVLSQESLYPKFRNVSVIVAKINDFENLSESLDTAELSSFLTEYRKSASQIITSYGGVIEALLQDEIVAIFNAPDEQNDAELKSVCAAVEVLHELAGMTKKRRSEGKEMVTGKIGIGMRALSYYSESGVPDSVKNVIKDARYICDNANLWKVYVASELYEEIKNFVDVKEFILDGEALYSITGVEQGVVQRENYS